MEAFTWSKLSPRPNLYPITFRSDTPNVVLIDIDNHKKCGSKMEIELRME